MRVVVAGMVMVMVKCWLTLIILLVIKIVFKIQILFLNDDSDGIVFRSNGLLFTDFWKVLIFDDFECN